MQAIRVERHIGGRTLAIETGTYAKLAGGRSRFNTAIRSFSAPSLAPSRARELISSPSRSITANAAPLPGNSPADL